LIIEGRNKTMGIKVSFDPNKGIVQEEIRGTGVSTLAGGGPLTFSTSLPTYNAVDGDVELESNTTIIVKNFQPTKAFTFRPSDPSFLTGSEGVDTILTGYLEQYNVDTDEYDNIVEFSITTLSGSQDLMNQMAAEITSTLDYVSCSVFLYEPDESYVGKNLYALSASYVTFYPTIEFYNMSVTVDGTGDNNYSVNSNNDNPEFLTGTVRLLLPENPAEGDTIYVYSVDNAVDDDLSLIVVPPNNTTPINGRYGERRDDSDNYMDIWSIRYLGSELGWSFVLLSED
jgi:hypothetical protein